MHSRTNTKKPRRFSSFGFGGTKVKPQLLMRGPEAVTFKVHGRITKSHGKHYPVRSDIQRLDFCYVENEILHREERLEKYHPNYRKELQKWIASCCIGAITGILAFLLLIVTRHLSESKFENTRDHLKPKIYGFWSPGIAIFITANLVMATFAGLLVAFIEPVSAGSGIPEVKAYLNGSRWVHLLNVRTLICKVFGVSLAVSSGLLVGKEGPLVHTGACVAAGVTRGRSKTLGCDTGYLSHFRNHRDQRDFVSAGVSAGVAAAFGAPLGGILFALEEASSYWNPQLTWRAFFCSMVSTFTFNLLISINMGDPGNFNIAGLIVFEVSEHQGYHISNIPSFFVIAFFGGLCGASFNSINIKITKFRQKYIPSTPRSLGGRILRVLEVLFITLLTTMLSAGLPYYMGKCRSLSLVKSDDEFIVHLNETGQLWCDEGKYNPLGLLLFNPQEYSIKAMFSRHTSHLFEPLDMILAFFVYFICAVLTYGISVPSGLFVPCILMGSTFGRLMGWANTQFMDIGDEGTYALIGAAAMLGGATRMTISLTVILLEITNDIQFLLPLMLTLMVAKWVGDHFNGPLYDLHVALKGIPFLEPILPEWIGTSVLACDVMSNQVICINHTIQVSHLLAILKDCDHNGFPVVSTNEVKNLYQTSEEVTSSYSQYRKTSYQRESSNHFEIKSIVVDVHMDEDHTFMGLILRSQLLTLLKEKNFASLDTFRSHGGLPQIQHLHSSDFTARHFKKEYNVIAEDFDLTADDLDMYVDLRPYMHASPYTVIETMPLLKVYQMFRAMALRHLVVVSFNKKHTVRGIITAHDLTEASLEQKVIQLNRKCSENPFLFEERMDRMRGN